MDCRTAAARCLSAVARQGLSLNRALAAREEAVAPRDRPLLRELCYGSLRYYPRLRGLLDQLLDKPLKAKDRDIEMLLVLGAYQLLYTRIPDHAAIGNTVDVCRRLKKPWAKGLVNGVLRRLQREGEALTAGLDDAGRAALPDWLYRRLARAWPEQLAAIIEAGNAHPPMTLRVNTVQTSREAYLNRLAPDTAEPCRFSPVGIRLQRPMAVTELPDFARGACSVQDEAAQLAAALLAPAPGERVLDACAAPGGKTGHLLEYCPAIAELVALDQDAERLNKVRDNLQRLGHSARLIGADAAATQSWWDGRPFDRILLDAPCSGTGVIRRHPDIKLLRRDSDIAALQQLQRQLLDALWQTLRPGGTLVYATCSTLPEENEQLINGFIEATADAAEQPIDAPWGDARPRGRQLFPTVDGHDGFYYAVLGKG